MSRFAPVWYVVLLIMLSLITQSIVYRHLDRQETRHLYDLSITAPETLYPPTPDQFVNEEFYRHALVRYAKKGYWVTEE